MVIYVVINLLWFDFTQQRRPTDYLLVRVHCWPLIILVLLFPVQISFLSSAVYFFKTGFNQIFSKKKFSKGFVYHNFSYATTILKISFTDIIP